MKMKGTKPFVKSGHKDRQMRLFPYFPTQNSYPDHRNFQKDTEQRS